jgi:PHD/YefM family antitoxin component YafN of YafNO toxin-antitoxin module
MGRTDSITVAELGKDAAAIVERARRSVDPLVLTSGGQAAAVILGIEAYQQGEYQRELLLRLLKGEQQIAAGIGHDLDVVMAEAEAICRVDAE